MNSIKKKKFDTDEIEFEVKQSSSQSDSNIKDEKKETKEVVGLFQLFKYSDGIDKLFIFLGIVFAIVCGAVFPLMFYIFGDLTNVFALQSQVSPEEFMAGVVAVVWKMSAIGMKLCWRLPAKEIILNIICVRWCNVGESLHICCLSQLRCRETGAEGEEDVLQGGVEAGHHLVRHHHHLGVRHQDDGGSEQAAGWYR